MNTTAPPTASRFRIGSERSEVPMEYDAQLNAVWAFMDPKGVPCFSLTLMRAIRAQDELLEASPGFVMHEGTPLPVQYYIGGSLVPDVYSYGGDLSLFLTFIRAQDREALRAYAKRCIDCLWARIVNFGARDMVTIALVQGSAFGGGWESALASDVIIAEAGTKFSFPEIKFSLFPGMGAITLLSKRVGLAKTREIVTSGDVYTAEEMHALGVVDLVAPVGGGVEATRSWIRDTKGMTGLRGILAAERITSGVSRAELDAIGDQWADTALQITDHDMRVMNRFLMRQQKATRSPQGEATMAAQDVGSAPSNAGTTEITPPAAAPAETALG